MDSFGLDYAAAVEANKDTTASLRDIVARHYYQSATAEWLASDVGVQALSYEAVFRYTNACRWVVPWVMKHARLAGENVVDIGAGTGATTAAFAHVAHRVTGYEIEHRSVEAANERFALLGVHNASIKYAAPGDLLPSVINDHPEGAQIVLLFAVLEHLTQAERSVYLSRIWTELLRPGGYLIVVDTPNRLGLFDAHTSELPFFHLLPVEVAIRYADRAPRAAFVDGMSKCRPDQAVEALHRWGLGLSYHDFELGFGQSLEGLIVANGFEWEMTNWFPPRLEDELMVRYFIDGNVPADLGFARSVLNLIFRKPMAGEVAACRPSIPEDHLRLLSSAHKLDSRIMSRLR